MSEKGTQIKVFFVELRSVMLFRIQYFAKRPMEGASWPRSYFEYIIGATKDDASVQKKRNRRRAPREEFLKQGRGLPPGQRYPNRHSKGSAFEGRAFRPIGTGPEDGEVCSEIVLSAAA